jgi:hypothetical protein
MLGLEILVFLEMGEVVLLIHDLLALGKASLLTLETYLRAVVVLQDSLHVLEIGQFRPGLGSSTWGL